jgi:hypothetical protein
MNAAIIAAQVASSNGFVNIPVRAAINVIYRDALATLALLIEDTSPPRPATAAARTCAKVAACCCLE